MEALWIAVTFALGLVVRAAGLPTLIGFLLAGFVLSGFGFETAESGEALEHIAHLGILLLLFTVGLKLRFKSVLRAEVLGGALIHLALSSAVFAPLLVLATGMSWPVALALAVAFGFSSTVVAAKILEEKNELRAFHGRVAIGILIVQDLVAVAVLSSAGGVAPSPYAMLLLALPLVRPLLHRLLDLAGHDELLLLFGLLLSLVGGGVAFAQVGLSSELGALVMGALIAGHPRAKELADAMWGLKEVFLVGFFLQIGLHGLPSWSGLGIALLLCAVLPLKSALFLFVLMRFKLRARSSFLAGLSLGNYSEFGLIVAKLGVGAGWIGPDWLVLFAVTVAISFVISAPLNRHAHVLYERFSERLIRLEHEERHPDDEPLSLGSATVVVVGMGRVGTGAYDQLSTHGRRVVGLDSDPAKVQRHSKEHRRVVYADAEDPGFWQNLRTDGIEAFVLATPDHESKRHSTEQLRRAGYKGLVAATTVYPEETRALAEAGCDLVFDYVKQVGHSLAERVFTKLESDTPDAPAQAPESARVRAPS